MTSDVEKFVNFCKSELGRKITEREAEYIRVELKPGDKVLNVGCGVGWLEKKLQDFDVVGLDSSEEMVKEARTKHSNKIFVIGDAEKLEFEDRSFDVVTYITTLEFLPNYKNAIREACRVLKQKGRLVAMIINPMSGYFKKRVRREGSYFRRIRHTSLREIENCIAKYFSVSAEYFLGIKDTEIFDTSDKNLASLYVINGLKK